MGRGYVAIVSIDLHLPTSDSLKAKRGDVRSLKADLQHRFGAAVAEVDHHDLRQRALITAALVDRRSSDLGGRARGRRAVRRSRATRRPGST